MKNSHRKIFIEPGKYIYRYQFKFLKNIIKIENSFNSLELKDSIDKFVVYNLISDIEKKDTTAASLVWFDEPGTVAYQFPQKGKIVEELARIGFNFPILDEDLEDFW